MTQTFYPSVSSNETIHYYSSNTAITNSIQFYSNVGSFYKKKVELSSHLSTYYSSSPLPNSLFTPFINSVRVYSYNNIGSNITLSYVSEELEPPVLTPKHTFFPLFWTDRETIKVPKKLVYTLTTLFPKKVLKTIDNDLNVAIDLCLLFTTQLTSTYFEMLNGDNSEGWKSLKAEYLRDQLHIDPESYRRVREVLEYPLIKGSILECDYKKEIGSRCYNYRLGGAFIGKGIEKYSLRTDVVKSLLNKHLTRAYKAAAVNPICKNLIELYPIITLPTIEEIMEEAKRLVSNNYFTKKGKRLIFKNKHKKSYFKNPETLSFVEEGIEIFEYLTNNGLKVPIEGSKESGGRIVDSFNLMPSWIRNLIKIEGEPIVEIDYSCLHPNIAMNLYGGSKEFLTHQDIASITGIDLYEIKKEHLSFFNKHPKHMKKSPLYNHYIESEPKMMANILSEKTNSKSKYKITSRKLFKKEVEIMTEVVKQLNQDGIYVGYIYDALFCHPLHAAHVKSVMDEIVIKHGVKTSAKISESRNKIISKKITPEKPVELQTTGTNLFLLQPISQPPFPYSTILNYNINKNNLACI